MVGLATTLALIFGLMALAGAPPAKSDPKAGKPGAAAAKLQDLADHDDDASAHGGDSDSLDDLAFECEIGDFIRLVEDEQGATFYDCLSVRQLKQLLDAEQNLVFVADGFVPGNVSGLSGADQRCSVMAQAANLSGQWVAWLSTAEVNAIDRLTGAGPFVRTDGKVVAGDKFNLTRGSLENPINRFANGTLVGKFPTPYVWTGTGDDGSAVVGENCNNWKSQSSSVTGTVGDPLSAGSSWTDTMELSCGMGAYLYCFQQQ